MNLLVNFIYILNLKHRTQLFLRFPLNVFSLYSNKDEKEVSKIRAALLEYCKLDTFAMVKLLEHLENI